MFGKNTNKYSQPVGGRTTVKTKTVTKKSPFAIKLANTKEFLSKKAPKEEKLSGKMIGDIDSFLNRYRNDRKHNTMLIKAGTGCGKNYTIEKIIEATPHHVLFVADRVASQNQIEERLSNIPNKKGTYEVIKYHNLQTFFNKDGSIKQTQRSHANTIVVIDECHMLFKDSTYAEQTKTAVEIINNIKLPKILMSASIDEKIAKAIFQINSKDIYTYKSKTIPNIIAERPYSTSKNVEIIAEKITNKKLDKAIMFFEEKKTMYNMKEYIEELNPALSVAVITADTRNTKFKDGKDYLAYLKLTTQETLGVDILLCTSTIETGINIKKQGKRFAILTESIDPMAVQQQVGRVRHTENDYPVVVFSSIPKDHVVAYRIEQLEEKFDVLVKRYGGASAIRDIIKGGKVAEVKENVWEDATMPYSDAVDFIETERLLKAYRIIATKQYMPIDICLNEMAKLIDTKTVKNTIKSIVLSTALAGYNANTVMTINKKKISMLGMLSGIVGKSLQKMDDIMDVVLDDVELFRGVDFFETATSRKTFGEFTYRAYEIALIDSQSLMSYPEVLTIIKTYFNNIGKQMQNAFAFFGLFNEKKGNVATILA